MRLAVDVSSILWTCLRTGVDREGWDVVHNGKTMHVNSAAYAYEFAINSAIAAWQELDVTPIDTVLVVEGMSSKAPRMQIDPDYKKNRDKKPDAEYIEFQKLRDMFVNALKALGAIALIQDQAEGDDVLAWLAANLRTPLVIMTNDNDMQVLNGTNEHGAVIAVRVNGIIGQNKYGTFPFKYTTLYKAMVGDSSDSITGIPGFGPKAWEQLVTRFGEAGMEIVTRCATTGSLDELYVDAQTDKFVAKIFDGGKDLIRSYKLAKLYPNWVNTFQNPIQWKPGMCHGRTTDKRLLPYAAARRLITLDKWEDFKAWALAQIVKRPWAALDIETSVPVESDDWLAAKGNPDGVDVMGSVLTGMSLTFGRNMHYTVYIPVRHKDTNNVSSDALRDFVKQITDTGTRLVIHNTMFEGPVLYQEWGKAWADNGHLGFLPNWYDTKFAASYVDENSKLGLKALARKWFEYDQVEYKTVTTRQGPFVDGVGGKSLGETRVVIEPAVYRKPTQTEIENGHPEASPILEVPETAQMVELRQFKMDELTAAHVFDYACDDTVVTSAFYNFAQLFMEIENTAHILEQVELEASYLHAHSFVKGVNVDAVKLQELIKEDNDTYESAKLIVDGFLIEKGWDGTVCPVYSTTLTPADIKQAYEIVTGAKLETAIRTLTKLVDMVAQPLLKSALTLALADDFTVLNKLVSSHFQGAPNLNMGSPKQLQKLLYETLGLPVKLYNKPTEAMVKRGETTGTPKTDNLAITYALLDADERQTEVLENVRLMKMVKTRFSLFYDTLPGFIHWKTGRVHSNHNQCATNTRRASSSEPNTQQLSKNEKVEGFSPRVRELYIPHKKNAVIVSLDFSSQELVLMAEWSGDEALTSCFVGDNPTDMHSMTGVGIHNNLWGTEYSYDIFCEILAGRESVEQKRVKKSRALGKAVNFGGIYRIAAKKLSTMLLMTEVEAQASLDAKAAAFPEVEAWSLSEMEEVQATGVVKTMMGAVRHLRDAVLSHDRVISSKAPRQALSYRIQGSAAEMTKLAEGRMWSANLLSKFDCEFFGAIHDEVVWSVSISDLVAFIPAAYACMTSKYANMQIPIESSVSVGWDFGRQVELKGDFSQTNINKALHLNEAA